MQDVSAPQISSSTEFLNMLWSSAAGKLDSLQLKLDYTFLNQSLLKEALTHSSAVREMLQKQGLEAAIPQTWNERLEFLGDSVLGLVVTTHLVQRHGALDEGRLSKIRARIVCEGSLAAAARELGLGEHLMLSYGEERSAGREKDSILADAFEALVAAVYLDGGYPLAERFVCRFFAERIIDAGEGDLDRDYKTTLQEIIQQRSKQTPEYELIGRSGPAHAPEFLIQVKVSGKVLGRGTGSSKKRASQNAALDALKNIAAGEP